jgi:hypothetical protein
LFFFLFYPSILDWMNIIFFLVPSFMAKVCFYIGFLYFSLYPFIPSLCCFRIEFCNFFRFAFCWVISFIWFGVQSLVGLSYLLFFLLLILFFNFIHIHLICFRIGLRLQLSFLCIMLAYYGCMALLAYLTCLFMLDQVRFFSLSFSNFFFHLSGWNLSFVAFFVLMIVFFFLQVFMIFFV